MMTARRPRLWTRTAAVWVLILAVAPAGAIDWTDPGTDDWTDGTNWNTGLQPGPGDKANIFNGGTAYIDTNAGTIQRFELAGPSGTTSGFLEIRNGGSLTTNNSGNTYVGARGLGRLTIEDGASLTVGPGPLYVGWRGAGSQQGDGTVIQNGGTVSIGRFLDLGRDDSDAVGRYEIHGGSLTVAQWCQVGRRGTGTFLQTGGTVNVNRPSGDPALIVGSQGGSTGTYTMTGGILNVPNIDMAVGDRGTGTFQLDAGTCNFGGPFVVGKRGVGDGTFIQNGGIVNASRYLDLGRESATATGRYEMHGGTLTVAQWFQVGRLGTGTLIQTAGDIHSTSTADGSGFYVGAQNGGSGLYQMSGGTLTVAGETIVGRNGGSSGTMELSGNAILSTNEFWVGENGTGVVRVSGNAQLDVRTSGTNFRIGHGGDGTLIQTGGTVTQPGNGAMYVGYQSSGIGRYSISAGSLDQGSLSIAYGGSTGIFTQTGGDVFCRRDLRIGRGSGGDGSYTISNGTLTVTGEHGDGDLLVGRDSSATGAFTQSGGIVDVDRHVTVGNESGNTGTYTMSGGQLDVPNGYIYVGKAGTGTFILNSGDVATGSAFRMATDNANAVGYCEIHGGTLTVDSYLQVGRLGTGTLIQTGGVVTVNRNAIAVSIGDKAGGRGTYRISGGKLDVTRDVLGVGVAGVGMLDVLGGAADIDTVGYSQNSSSTLRSAIGNSGITTVDVSGSASISGGAMLDVDIWGGVALTTGTSFNLLRTATAGNIAGAFTVIDPEPMWSVTQDGTVVQAVLNAPGLGPISAGYGPLTELSVGGGGSNVDWLTIDECINCEGRLLVALDVVDAQGDLDPTELEALADYMRSSGQTVVANGIDDHTVFDYLRYANYDLVVEFQPEADTSYFAWDFSDYDPSLLVRGLGVGLVPEPATLSLLGLGLLALARRRRRR